jgi:multidrug efflux pump subunit AcrB
LSSEKSLANSAADPVPATAVRDQLARMVNSPGFVSSVSVSVNTTGELKSIDDLRNVLIGTSPNGTPLYLRDLVDIDRGYENPPSFLNRYTRRD